MSASEAKRQFFGGGIPGKLLNCVLRERESCFGGFNTGFRRVFPCIRLKLGPTSTLEVQSCIEVYYSEKSAGGGITGIFHFSGTSVKRAKNRRSNFWSAVLDRHNQHIVGGLETGFTQQGQPRAKIRFDWLLGSRHFCDWHVFASSRFSERRQWNPSRRIRLRKGQKRDVFDQL